MFTEGIVKINQGVRFFGPHGIFHIHKTAHSFAQNASQK